MVIQYDISDWKNLMKVCGTVAASGNANRPALGYISVYADTFNNVTTCYACNGYQAGKLVIPCRLQDVPHNYRLMILPVKTSQDGSGKYFIAVNPKYLISALEGMKSCKRVILNFAERNQAFTIRPFNDGSIDTTALVLPVRITV